MQTNDIGSEVKRELACERERLANILKLHRGEHMQEIRLRMGNMLPLHGFCKLVAQHDLSGKVNPCECSENMSNIETRFPTVRHRRLSCPLMSCDHGCWRCW